MITNNCCQNVTSKIFDGTVKKGEIWNIDQGKTTSTGTEIGANRPAIIVSNDATNMKAGFVNVVYLTTSNKRDMPYHVPVKSGDKNAIALCEQIFAIDKSRISFYVGSLSEEEMLEVDKALLFSLGISNSLRPNTLFKKWLSAVTRYNIDLSGNPLVSTISNPTDKTLESNPNDTVILEKHNLIKERDMYKELYESERRIRETYISNSSNDKTTQLHFE